MRSLATTKWLVVALLLPHLAGCAADRAPAPNGGADRTAKAILGVRISGQRYAIAGTIHPVEPRIDVTVPAGTDRRALVPVIVHSGVRLTPPSGVAQDFTSPVRYTVHAADGSSRAYLVHVTEASANPPSEWAPEAWHAPAPGRMAAVADGFLVTQPRLGEVWHYDPDGALLERVPVGFRVTAVAGLPDGQWLLGDEARRRVLAFAPSRRRTVPFGSAEVTAAAIAVDGGRGRVYLTDTARHQVVVTDLAGVTRARFGEPGEGPGQLRYPAGVAVDPVSGDVAVADLQNRRVVVFDAVGAPQRVIRQVETPSLVRPVGVAYDRSGRLYVADSLRGVVFRFDGDGTYLGTLGRYGTREGELRTPQDLLVFGGRRSAAGSGAPAPTLRVLVADYRNQRITRLAVPAGEGL